MLSNKKLNPIVTGLFLREGTKISPLSLLKNDKYEYLEGKSYYLIIKLK